MAGFSVLVGGLRRAEAELEGKLRRVRDAIAALASDSAQGRRTRPTSGRAGSPTVARKRRKLSAKARRAISDAQKKRWAAVRATKKG